MRFKFFYVEDEKSNLFFYVSDVQFSNEQNTAKFTNKRSSAFLNSSHVADTEIELNNCCDYVGGDAEFDWEMIFHEAAIFLEVIDSSYLCSTFEALLVGRINI